MRSVWHAIAADYQKHFDNKILLLFKKKKKPSVNIYCITFIH